MRWLILGLVGVYAYLVIDALESKTDNVAKKRRFSARLAVLLLASITAIFAQSANSLEGKLADSQSQLASAEQQNSQLESQIRNYQTAYTELQNRLNAVLSFSQPTTSNFSSTDSGPTAKCVDGSYSYAANHRGACSHHGGVAEWYR